MQTAKNKQPSREDIRRNRQAKALASAAKLIPALDLDKARERAVVNIGTAEAGTRVYAMALNQKWKSEMAAFRCHWADFTSANCRTDNEKAVLAAVNDERKLVRDLADKKGQVNVDMPWSRIKKMAKEIANGVERRERDAKPLDARQKLDLTRLYKACMKEERPTELELEVNDAIGKLLIAKFKVDLSTLG